MVHLRARNLPSRGVLKEWLFKGDKISFGDDFALVQLDSGQTITIKSNYNGLIVKTVKLNTPIKNGSILANIAIGEKEINKFKNRYFKKEEQQDYFEDEIILENVNTEKLKDIQSEADEFSGAVLYDKYNQARTPFSSNDQDIVNSKEKYLELEEKENMQDNPINSKDRFAQMRANIKNSIKNAPNNQINSSIPKDELLKMNNSDLIKQEGNNIFSTDNVEGVSKFRQLVQARKEKLLEENEFKEVEDNSDSLNAMSKTDDKGRPLIMRNIIAARMEKLNKAGGDPSVLSDNFNENLEKKVKVTHNFEEFDEEPIDINDTLSSKNGVPVLPKKKPEQLIQEIKRKDHKSYYEAKLSNLYDGDRRWNIFKDNDQKVSIEKRKQAIEQGLNDTEHFFSNIVDENQIPREFLKKVPEQDVFTGQVKYIPYKDTKDGKREFDIWLRSNNLYSAYTEEQEYLKTIELEEEVDGKTPRRVQKKLVKELVKQNDQLKEIADEQTADETVNYLKKQIEKLEKTLEDTNKLNAATSKLNQNTNSFTTGTDTFSQLMQYMIVQSLMQNIKTNNQNIEKTNSSTLKEEIKNLIKDEINSFKSDILKQKQHDFDQEGLQNVNFEKDRPDTNIGHFGFESNNEYKQITRQKINQNRNEAVKSMILSQSYIPPLTISTEIDMSAILKLKYVLKQTQSNLKFPTIAFVIKAISITLEQYPKLNSSYDPETNEIIIKKYHNIGLATETSAGLVIPVLKYVEKLSIKEVAIDIKEVTQRLRAGQLYDYEADGSTITIANYGNIGAIQATPTIFYPNAAVIGVGKVVKKPVVVDNEKLAIKAMINISLTVDQRIIDAAEAGGFLEHLKKILEKPELLTVS